MAVRQLDLALAHIGNHRVPAFEAGTAVTRHVRVSWDTTIRRDALRNLLKLGEEILALRLVAEGEAVNS